MRLGIVKNYRDYIFGFLVFLTFIFTKKFFIYFYQELNIVLFVFVFTFALSSILIAPKKINTSLFLFLIFVLFSSGLLFIYDESDYGVYKYLSLVFLVFIVYLLKILVKPVSLENTLLAFGYSLLLYGIIAFVITYIVDGVSINIRPERIGYNGPIVFGQYMLVSFFILLFFSKNKLLSFVPFLMSILSYSKGPLLSSMLVLIVYRAKYLIALVVLVLVVSMGGGNRFATYVNKIETSNLSLSVISDHAFWSSLLGARLEMYETAWGLLNSEPLGIGFGNWNRFSEYNYPHNFIVEIIVELGFIVGLSYLLLLFLFYRKLMNKKIKLLFLLFFLFSMFSGSILDNRGIYLILLLYFQFKNQKVALPLVGCVTITSPLPQDKYSILQVESR